MYRLEDDFPNEYRIVITEMHAAGFNVSRKYALCTKRASLPPLSQLEGLSWCCDVNVST